MYEVEVKVPADIDAVADRLDELDARRLGTTTQVDAYYDHPERSFAETDEALRVRRENGDAVLTYKGPLVEAESKTREEKETNVEDADALDDILQALGFEPAATVRKDRTRYRVEDYTVTLDRVDGAGEFVEVEAEGAEAEIEPLREGAYDVLRDLGLDPADQIRTSYLELILDAGE